MEYKEYRDDRLMESYQMYLRGETFKKARAIILDDEKVVLINDLGKKVITLPGGGVENGETVLEAAKREAKEETGYDVEPIMIVYKESYEVPMKIGDIDFVSTRESFYVLCDLKNKGNGKGLDGEYEKGVKIFTDDIDKLSTLHVSKSGIEAVKAFVHAKQ